jgi:hypothetical protein
MVDPYILQKTSIDSEYSGPKRRTPRPGPKRGSAGVPGDSGAGRQWPELAALFPAATTRIAFHEGTPRPSGQGAGVAGVLGQPGGERRAADTRVRARQQHLTRHRHPEQAVPPAGPDRGAVPRAANVRTAMSTRSRVSGPASSGPRPCAGPRASSTSTAATSPTSTGCTSSGATAAPPPCRPRHAHLIPAHLILSYPSEMLRI